MPCFCAKAKRMAASGMAGMFCKVLAESETPDIQFHFGTLSADQAAGKPHDFSGCTYSVCQLRPESRGHLRITSKDSRDAPKMLFNYLATENDQRTMVEAVKFARKVASSKPIAHLMKREHRPGQDIKTDDEILAFCKQFGTTIFHPSCTAKMGRKDDPMAVVDERLRVHGIQGLRVVDCSVMPTLVSGNTNVPVVMIGEKAADMILADCTA